MTATNVYNFVGFRYSLKGSARDQPGISYGHWKDYQGHQICKDLAIVQRRTPDLSKDLARVAQVNSKV